MSNLSMVQVLVLCGIVVFCVGGSHSAADDAPVFRLTLHVDEYGDGKVSIKKAADPASTTTFEGEAFKFAALPKAKAVKRAGGQFRIEHDFADADPISAFSMTSKHAELKAEKKGLRLTPRPIPGSDVATAAFVTYGKRFKLPITVTCDIAESGAGGFGIKLRDPRAEFGLVQFRTGATGLPPTNCGVCI